MKAVSIGELTVDWLSLECGESMMSATRFYRYMGGNATNVAVGLSRLGLDSAIISKVGADIHGEYLLHSLSREKVDSRWVICDPAQATAQCYMTRRADGFPDYYAWPSPNASKTLEPDDLPDECFESSWIWHLAAVSFIAKPRRFAMTHAVEEAHRRARIISIDACFPLVESDGGKTAARRAMQKADILKFNLAEICYWSGMPPGSEHDAMAKVLMREFSPALLVLTLAQEGAKIYTKDASAFCPPYKVESLGDVGPGDAFSAGLIYGLHTLGKRGMERDAIYELNIDTWHGLASYGACAGALVTRAYSATEKFPSLDELNLALGKITL
ncbi:MAG: hypothetical protein K2X27_07450 [Candidatus Obscuribacterales bacterium]|nr:hypothetical protein [Candidatus Obscuribacterales bacterium]